MKHFSATELNTFLKCPFAWYMQYQMKMWPPKTDALFYGIGIHEALSLYHQNQDPVVALERFFNTDPYIPSSFDKEGYFEKGKKLLEVYKKDGPAIDKIISLEEKKTVELHHPESGEVLPVPFTFKIDMVCDSGGKRFVTDFKTMKSGGTSQDKQNRYQGILYVMAHKELYGSLPDGFMQIALVGTKTPKVIPLPIEYSTEDQIEVWELAKQVLDIIEEGKALETPPMVSSFYPCTFKNFCPWHQYGGDDNE